MIDKIEDSELGTLTRLKKNIESSETDKLYTTEELNQFCEDLWVKYKLFGSGKVIDEEGNIVDGPEE